MAIPSMSRLGALKISLENDLVHIYAKWGSSSSLRTDFPPGPRLLVPVAQGSSHWTGPLQVLEDDSKESNCLVKL